MWAIKFLSGPKAGQEILLQKGLILIGKDRACQIQLNSSRISKRHARITIDDQGCKIEDLNSRNGTFLGGTQIQSRKLQVGDQVGLCDIIFEVRKKKLESLNSMYHPAYSMQSGPELQQAKISNEEKVLKAKNAVSRYLHEVFLPGVYKLAEWLEFKWVVGIFVIGFIFMVTALSSLPLVKILKSSVEQESLHHAETIALNISKLNRGKLREGLETALDVSYAQRRPGVKQAYIISALTGRILAPAGQAHTYPKTPFIHEARKLNAKSVKKIDSSTVAAVAPIRFYNPETGEHKPEAYAAVLYDMNVLARGSKKTFSLIMQNLLIACALGGLIFFLLINLIEFPLLSINKQLAESLKDDKSPPVSVSYQSVILNKLCENINNALNRISLNQSMQQAVDTPEVNEFNRTQEQSNLVELIGFPSLTVDLETESVGAVNSSWSDQIEVQVAGQTPVEEIPDDILKEEVKNLVEQSRNQQEEISFGELDLKGMKLQTTCQVIMGSTKPAYALIVFMPVDKEAA